MSANMLSSWYFQDHQVSIILIKDIPSALNEEEDGIVFDNY